MEEFKHNIEAMIYVIRGHRVMLDSDLAKLYGVETGALNRQVQRNLDRFPDDFMYRLSVDEYEELRCQIGISKGSKGGRRYQPLVFTESGVAMLSSVLKSKQAIKINISIMRVFIKLRSFLSMDETLEKRVDALESETQTLFKLVFKKLDSLELEGEPRLSSNRKRIGFHTKKTNG